MTLFADMEKRLGEFYLSVSLSASGVTGILGPSGSGKTKMLQCIAGIERPDRGHIAVNGRVFFDGKKRVNMAVQERRVGYLFQHYALFPHMTVAENIACGIRGAVGKKERRTVVADMMERFGLTGLERRKPAQISGGQQQRTALARILVGDPDVLLLDEPFSALDASLKEQVMTELSDLLAQFRKDVVIVTHSYEEAYRLCSSVAVLCSGRVETFGRTGDVFAQPRSRTAAALMGCANIVAAEKRGLRRVYVPAWHREFTVAADVGDGLQAVGIREHSFRPGARENHADVTVVKTVSLPFDCRVYFRYNGQSEDSPNVSLRMEKDGGDISGIGVSPEDILLLYR